MPSVSSLPDTSASLSPVKTPRLDLTIGFRHQTFIDALTFRGISRDKAYSFLNYLQQENILYSDVTIKIRFPFIVIEGKAYATGKQIFEAQNQAAVSGSCIVNLQHTLADLTSRIRGSSCNDDVPLAFSITTEGPYHEL